MKLLSYLLIIFIFICLFCLCIWNEDSMGASIIGVITIGFAWFEK